MVWVDVYQDGYAVLSIQWWKAERSGVRRGRGNPKMILKIRTGPRRDEVARTGARK